MRIYLKVLKRIVARCIILSRVLALTILRCLSGRMNLARSPCIVLLATNISLRLLYILIVIIRMIILRRVLFFDMGSTRRWNHLRILLNSGVLLLMRLVRGRGQVLLLILLLSGLYVKRVVLKLC